MSDWCSDPWRERRDGEEAARRGWLSWDEREKVREGLYASYGSCEREFYDAYRSEERRIEERREEEAEAARRAEQIEYERRRQDAQLEEERIAAEDYYYQGLAEEAAKAQIEAPAPSPEERPDAHSL